MPGPERPSRQAYQTVKIAASDVHDDDSDDESAIASAINLDKTRTFRRRADTADAAAADDHENDDDNSEDDDLFADDCCRQWGRELAIVVGFGWANSVNQVLQFTAGFVMMMFLSTADEVGGAGMGFMFGNVTGISLIVGFGTGLTPLASQAFGAGNFRRVGDLLQRQILMHVLLVCAPVTLVWLYAEQILLFFQQPAEISALTGDFLRWRIAALPFIALQGDLETVLQCAQAPVLPRTLLYAASAALNGVLFWLFIGGEGEPGSPRLGMGFVGAPCAFTVTNVVTSLVLLWLAPRLAVSASCTSLVVAKCC
jgi:Na+-driven multidrug efflux pump